MPSTAYNIVVNIDVFFTPYKLMYLTISRRVWNNFVITSDMDVENSTLKIAKSNFILA